MSIERSRITLLVGGGAFVLTLGTRLGAWAAPRPVAAALPEITVYKSPT